MKVQVYAMLKDYFNEEMTMDMEGIQQASDLIGKLSELNPSAAAILKRCRMAVEMKFVSGDYKLNAHDIISIIPPSSGG
jgi:molybdopterin converting factor small subunit